MRVLIDTNILFVTAPLPVLTPSEFLAQLESSAE